MCPAMFLQVSTGNIKEWHSRQHGWWGQQQLLRHQLHTTGGRTRYSQYSIVHTSYISLDSRPLLVEAL